MRRGAGVVILAILVAMVPALSALGTAADYGDDFSAVSYTENDGVLDFAGPWMEFGDDGSPNTGLIYVGDENCSSNMCLHLEGPDLGVVLADFGISRSADTEILNSVLLRYDVHVVGSLGDSAQLKVEVWDGANWVVVKSYPLAVSTSKSENVSLNGYLSATFKVRFRVPGVTGGGILFNGAVTVDNVQLSGSLSSTTTTTSTSSTTTSSAPTTTTTSTTTTTTSPTTTTTSPTTTTTSPTTTTTEPTTTSTEPHRTTTTTRAPTTTSTVVTTTSTNPTSTTTTLIAIAAGEDTTPAPPEFEAGMHDMGDGKGLMYDIHEGMNGDLSGLDDVEVLSAAVTADFSLAVEAFKSTTVWLAALSLMIAAALVSGMDHRRRIRGEFATLSAGQPVVEG
jgi:hypothetical protein